MMYNFRKETDPAGRTKSEQKGEFIMSGSSPETNPNFDPNYDPSQYSSDPMERRLLRLTSRRKGDPDPTVPNTQMSPDLVSFDSEQRIAELAYETREWMKNPLGQVHGGMVGLLMDAGMGATVYSVYGFTAPSITMTLNYIRPVPADTRIHVRTHLVSCGKNTCHAVAEMTAEGQPDRVLVTATSVFHIGGKPMRT